MRIPKQKYWFVEEVTEEIGGVVTASKIRDATEQDISKARKLHAKGKCPHNVVFDTRAYAYDIRTCAICGAGRGVV